MEYIYLSLKHTNKKDKWFTMWRSNHAGYTFFMDYAGKYHEPYDDNESVASIPLSEAITYLKKEIFEGKERVVFPNNPETREKFGINKESLLEPYPYRF